MNIKEKLKKIPAINSIKDNLKSLEFAKDRKFFMENYMYSKPMNKKKIEYELLLEIHKLEKGFASTKPRPFGIDKVRKIITLLEIYKKEKYEMGFSSNLAYSSLEEYLKFYESKNWKDKKEYSLVKEFMSNNNSYITLPVGAVDIHKENFIKDSSIDYSKFLDSRKSVRNFSNKNLKESDITKAINMAIKTPTACNRQMCNIYFMKNDNSKKIIEKYAQGLGLFNLENANYFLITFDISANYFIGERNQGWFNAGLMTMNFVNSLHSLGIGSCCIQFGNSFDEEKKIKKILNIPKSERIAIIICCGYYDDISRVPYSTRKNIRDIYFER